MNVQENHQHLVSTLNKDPDEIYESLDLVKINAIHACLGLAGETGEVIDIVKKYAVQNKPLDKVHLVEELGDIEFYLEALRQAFEVSREETLQGNVSKLSKRYPTGYSDEAAAAQADKK